MLTFADDEGKKVYRHTAAHVLAQAVKNIYPTVKLAIGPSIENGFYYDFDFKTPITQDDFDKIEAEMHKIIKANLPITRFVLPRKDALELMKNKGEIYKIQLIEELPEGALITESPNKCPNVSFAYLNLSRSTTMSAWFLPSCNSRETRCSVVILL